MRFTVAIIAMAAAAVPTFALYARESDNDYHYLEARALHKRVASSTQPNQAIWNMPQPYKSPPMQGPFSQAHDPNAPIGGMPVPQPRYAPPTYPPPGYHGAPLPTKPQEHTETKLQQPKPYRPINFDRE